MRKIGRRRPAEDRKTDGGERGKGKERSGVDSPGEGPGTTVVVVVVLRIQHS